MSMVLFNKSVENVLGFFTKLTPSAGDITAICNGSSEAWGRVLETERDLHAAGFALYAAIVVSEVSVDGGMVQRLYRSMPDAKRRGRHIFGIAWQSNAGPWMRYSCETGYGHTPFATIFERSRIVFKCSVNELADAVSAML